MKKLLPLFLLATLSGCDLGEGSKLASLEIVSATGATIPVGGFPAYLCFRDRLNVIGRFSNGDIGNFSTRVTWASDNENIVKVLNRGAQSTRQVFSRDGVAPADFNNVNGLFYTPGTVVPVAAGTTTVRAAFLGLTASVLVTVGNPVLTVDVSPIEGMTSPATIPTGIGFSRDLTVRAVRAGQTTDAVLRRQDPGTLELLNPILWQFTSGTFSPGNLAATDSVAREDLFLFPAGSTRADAQASLNPSSGRLRGMAAGSPTVQAVFDTASGLGCPGPTPPAAVSAPIEAVSALILEHEKDFNGAGITNGDLVVNTDELLKTTATLASGSQDVSSQVGYEVILADRDACVPAGNCAADANRASSILTFTVNQLTTAPGTNGSFVTNSTLNPGAVAAGPAGNARFFQDNMVDVVNIRACAPNCSATTMTAPPSANLPIRAVPATLPLNSIAITPDAQCATSPTTASETAFTFPGCKFNAFATFSAIAPNVFTGSGMQNVSRYMGWIARPTGSTTTVSDVVSLFGLYNSTLNAGQAYYLRNPVVPTVVDITAIPATSTRIGVFTNAASSTIAPSKLTINPAP